jgi:hypothetical protein
MYDEKGSMPTSGQSYTVSWMTTSDHFGGHRFLHAIVYMPGRKYTIGGGRSGMWQQPHGRGLESFPNGVFVDGKLVGGYGTTRVLVLNYDCDIRVIPLTPADIEYLSTVQEGALVSSIVWKTKVEPEIHKLELAPPPE